MGEKERFGKLIDTKVPPLRKYRCENCFFFAAAIPGKLPQTCRKSLPVMVAGPQGVGVAGMFTPTEPTWWCGAWEEQIADAYEASDAN